MQPHTMVWTVLSVFLLSSCGSATTDTDESAAARDTPRQSEARQQEAQDIIEQQMKSLQEKEASTFPCRLWSQEAIEALAGNPLDKGSYTFVNAFENDREYQREECSWSAKGGQGTAVGLWVSLPKHFASGQVECSPGSEHAKIAGIGDQAWWDYQKFAGMGTLRVCSARAMLEVNVDLEGNDEALARTIAQTMSEHVLASQ
jgi:hypothetical protein